MNSMKKTLRTAAFATAFLFSGAAFAADIDHSADANDIAIKGYDPVSYFTAGKPQQGSTQYMATYKNAIYQFTSEKNRDAFRSDPAKYAPQYGGYCAFGAAMGKKFDTDPTAWRIVDNKLYLNLNSDVQKKWVGDIPGYISTANNNWLEIKNKLASEL